MTVELNRLSDDLPFEQVKDRVGEKILEVQADMGRQASTAERLRVARDLMGYFTVEELAEAAGVAKRTARYKIDYWVSTGEIRAATTTETGAVFYGVVDSA